MCVDITVSPKFRSDSMFGGNGCEINKIIYIFADGVSTILPRLDGCVAGFAF